MTDFEDYNELEDSPDEFFDDEPTPTQPEEDFDEQIENTEVSDVEELEKIEESVEEAKPIAEAKIEPDNVAPNGDSENKEPDPYDFSDIEKKMNNSQAKKKKVHDEKAKKTAPPKNALWEANKKKLIPLIAIIAVFGIILIAANVGKNKEPDETTVAAETTLSAEEQLLADSYKADSSYEEKLFLKDIKIYTPHNYIDDMADVVERVMMDEFPIQIDNVTGIVLGKTTMGEIVKEFELENIAYNEEHEGELAPRIKWGEETEENATTESASTTEPETTKASSKEWLEDDYKIYTFKVSRGYNDTEDTFYNYQPTLLMSPSENEETELIIYKYGAPYMRLEFHVTECFNNEIIEQQDWICTGIRPYKMLDLDDEDIEVIPEYVDVDGRNIACKQNTRLFAGITSIGGGYNWDTLNVLFASVFGLKDVEETGSSVYGYEKSVYGDFAYYDVNFYSSMIFESEEGGWYIPIYTLEAVVDAETHECFSLIINVHTKLVRIGEDETYEMSEVYESEIPDFGDLGKVDLKEYLKTIYAEWDAAHPTKQIPNNEVPTMTTEETSTTAHQRSDK